ncbi:MAG TPA: hypothetical protein VKE94_09440 [Gemmataceae bacterium]|nr:hypothetical protein [Gemmataceae bacterium]
MNELASLPAPSLATPPEDKWRREQRAFRQLLPNLLASHRGLYVAIHEGQVVESGADKLAVASAAYARFGYVPIFVSLVSDQPPPPVRIPSPRLTYPGKPT